MDTMFQSNLILLTGSLVISFVIYYGSKIFNFQNLIKNFSSITIVKFILLNMRLENVHKVLFVSNR